ncbi:arginase family protein [Stylonychia lemnae]|uniref:Arginase family protein n=1 Tax=Stylonychia lemnae TaxID=5949 RepID=A0A078B8K9_STYLE|nr:arginase family protein [Stylonychia lemnae]|eukprot:CDW90855.1 arginase family protein [Stylonychia lemnae]
MKGLRTLVLEEDLTMVQVSTKFRFIFHVLDSFRRFVKKIGVIRNPEYQVDISKGLPKISDYGNIQIDTLPGQPKAQIQELLKKLQQKVELCIKRGNIPFIIGGSRDLFGAVSDALQKEKQESRNAYISISHRLDVDESTKDHIPQQTTNKRYLLEKMMARKNVLYEFGTHGVKTSQEQVEFFQERNPEGHIEWMNQIRKVQMQPNGHYYTQAGQKFYQLLVEKINKDVNVDQVYVSFNLESVEAAVGVTTNNTAGGFTSEEAIEISYLAGLFSHKLVAIDISEYNPFVEDWRTGRLVATMFYYFALGLSQRLQEPVEQVNVDFITQ